MSHVSLDEIMMCSNLPSLPAVAVRLLELTSDPDVAMSDIAQLVQQDQALAAKVLKTVNSSFYGLSTPCGSIERAMGYLGLNTVKSLVLGFSLVDTTRNVRETGFDLDAHWRRAIIGATGARIVAREVGGVDPEDVFTASLFQDMGMLACFTVMKEEYGAAIKGVAHRLLCKHERDVFGYDHAKVGSELATRWKLPNVIVEAIKYHHDPNACNSENKQIARFVSLGARVCYCMEPEAPASMVRTFDREMREWFGKLAPNTGTVLEEVTETANTLAKMFEQDIGSMPSPAELMSLAQEKGVEHQLILQRQADELKREALVDGLTQIANRKRFDAELTRIYNTFVKEKKDFGVLFFDADKFKSVNDTHGHAAGDIVLKELAKRTNDVVGSDGIVFRYGGEEFAVLVEGQGIDFCTKLAERVRATIADTPFDLRSIDDGPDELPVTASIGVSSTDAGSPTRLSGGEQVVHEADECVYAAKSDGRNNVKVFGRFNQVSIPNSDVLQEASKGGSSKQDAAPGESRPDRVMLVEDDALAAMLVISLMKRRGNIEVNWVKSGTKACTMIEQGELVGDRLPKLILCDFSLPGCDGHEVLRVAKEHQPTRNVPFVMLTGSNDQLMRDETLRRGATRFIHKDEFCADVNRWLNELINTTHSTQKAA